MFTSVICKAATAARRAGTAPTAARDDSFGISVVDFLGMSCPLVRRSDAEPKQQRCNERRGIREV
jgi:hypothetical protein